MVTRYGMVDSIGPLSYEREPRSFLGGPAEPPPQRNYSEATAQAIDRQVHNLVESAMQRATAILTERRDVLERGAQALLQRETLTADELQELIQETPKQPVPA
jgi:cell division protease FtsH